MSTKKILENFCSRIAKREGKKSNVKIGDVREIIGIISDIFYENKNEEADMIYRTLCENGAKRFKKHKQ